MQIAIAAHPDDIEFGMGGVISLLKDVACIISFQCTPQRQIEAIRALNMLGVSSENVYFTKGTTHRDIISEYDSIFKKLNPLRVFTHFYGDSHQEHRIVYDCVISALRKFPSTDCFLWENNQPGAMTHETFAKRIFIPIRASHLESKLNALSEHYTQMEKYEKEKLFGFLRKQAEVNGYMCGTELAEAFFPIKCVMKL